MHLVFDPTFCIAIVFSFSWVLQSSQVKSKTAIMQNFGGGGGGGWAAKFYGLCEIGEFTVKFTDVLALGTKLRLRDSDSPFVFFYVFNHVLKDFVVYSFVNVADFLQKIVSNMTSKIFRRWIHVSAV